MTHPLDRLAPFVDGTLGASERPSVDDHLRVCARCRSEVAAAGAALDALRSLPVPEGPDLAARFAPDRLAGLAPPSRFAGARAPWSKVIPALAAAAVVALVALVLPRVGGSSDDAGTGGGVAATEAGSAVGALRLEVVGIDYDEASLEAAATEFVAARTAGDAAGAIGQSTAGAEASPAAPGQARFAGPGPTTDAVACLERAFPGYPGELVRVQQASFRGTPAYLGFVLESPGAGAPADTVSIWVASVDDCTILSLTSARL